MSQEQTATFDIQPDTFNEDDEITITVSGIDTSQWGVTDVYLWAWYFDSPTATSAVNSPTNGEWTDSSETQKMTNNGNGTFSYTLTPTAFYNTTGIDRIGMLVKAKDGTGDKKTQDNVVNVGTFQITRIAPSLDQTILNSGEDLLVNVTSSIEADFELKANDVVINTATSLTNYNFTVTNITTNTNYELTVTSSGETITNTFSAVLKPSVIEEAVPAGLVDGINLDPTDNTKATLVLYAPGKEFVHLIGDFNNWQVNDTYLLKKDSAQDRFWIELTGLTPQFDHLYQYLVEFDINIADPYSTLILDGFGEDEFIDSETFANIPEYPANQSQAITVLRTGDPDYVWTSTDYTRPKKEDLVIYELLIRDFDERHNFDAVKDRLDYLEELGINAIELMPVNEYDGNLSWGYNPSFHMALDKYYGTKNALKELIDECHSRNIAVILDVVYNHASGQHPYYRMWNTDNGGTGGQAASDSPFFNPNATHSFSVFNDFNHQQQATKDYVNRTVTYWIEEFNIDGMRWDLTKGFTQNCASSDDNCTNSLQQDRIDVLKEYADNQWASDPDFYVIFEHLGGLAEEEQWADYRADEGKGIMLWNKQTDPYNEATLGFNENGKSNFSGVSYQQKGFKQPSAISYMESHDEERLMYKNLEFGNAEASYDVKKLSTALNRMQTAGAFFFTVPGPKMIWQFGELGYDVSIEENGRTGNKPILWQYADEPDRKAIYNLWSQLIYLKINEPIFETDNFTLDLAKSNGLKKIQLTLDAAVGNEIKHITIIGNFGVTSQAINPDFQVSGDWYEFLKFNKKITINDTQATITLSPGEFRIFGDQPSSLFPLDDDSDGVTNEEDSCPDTAVGSVVDVTGCAIFSLPADNFAVKTESETCSSSNNGSLMISSQNTTLNFTATINNDDTTAQTFMDAVLFENLEAGTYEVCITIDSEPDYNQCFTFNITEPDALEVSSKIDKSGGKVTLNLKGAERYQITLNSDTFYTEENQITLALNKNVNYLSVKTDKDCQGIFKRTITLKEGILMYPNPLRSGKLYIKFDTQLKHSVGVNVYSLTGKLVQTRTYDTNQELSVDMAALSKGNYLLQITSRELGTKTFKILKR